jgi:murein DD-endopeptidase MepM/ murein hydrolase activator NlpD
VPASGALGKPIYAARDGVVVASGPADGFGNWIVIKHTIDGNTYSTVYGHMYDDGLLVKVGDTVKAGQQIGTIGNNGQSSGPHLHFEIWDTLRTNPVCTRNGAAEHTDCSIDPAPIIEKAKTNGVAKNA